jgi:hypothetical protein
MEIPILSAAAEVLSHARESREQASVVALKSLDVLGAFALRCAKVVAFLSVLLGVATALYGTAYVTLVPRTKVSVPLYFDYDRAMLAPPPPPPPILPAVNDLGSEEDTCAAAGAAGVACEQRQQRAPHRRLEAMDVGASARRRRARVAYPTARVDFRLKRQQWFANASLIWGSGGGAEPLASRSGRLLHPGREYDVYLVMELPPSPANVASGVSMASLELRCVSSSTDDSEEEQEEERLLAASERSWMVPYRTTLQVRVVNFQFIV